MSQADIQALRTAFDDVERRGPEALDQLLDPQVEWFGIKPGPWDCHDRSKVLRTIREQLAPGVTTRVEELVEGGDKGRRRTAYQVARSRRGPALLPRPHPAGREDRPHAGLP